MAAERCAWLELLPAYALDALDAAERAGLEAHLRSRCDPCRRELVRLRRDVEALAGSPAPIAPPRRSRRRLVAAVRSALRSASRRKPPQ